jgi:lipoate-protein ligase B
MTTQGILLDLGLRDYTEIWELQRKLVQLRANKVVPDILVLVEHPHIFTVGKAVPGDVPSEIDGVPVQRIERGGQWTYHGPGQLVGYPILDLDARHRDIHRFLRNIEEALILAIDKFGVYGERGGQTGVWVGSKKVASIGAAIRNWISFHGFALNVNTDLSYFHMITPCGFPGSTMTSMQALLGREVDFQNVKKEVARTFEGIFELTLTRTRVEALETTTIH